MTVTSFLQSKIDLPKDKEKNTSKFSVNIFVSSVKNVGFFELFFALSPKIHLEISS